MGNIQRISPSTVETFEYWLQENIIIFLSVCVAVNFICDHPAIQAISFVGSNSAGEYIYERGSKNGKRVQSNMVRACASASRRFTPKFTFHTFFTHHRVGGVFSFLFHTFPPNANTTEAMNI